MRAQLPLLLFSVLLATTSCKKDRVGVNTNLNASPTLAFPIGDINLTLEHLIDPNDPNDTLISANAENTYQIVVARPNALADFDPANSLPTLGNLAFPALNKNIGNVEIPSASISSSVSMGYVINSGSTLASNLSAPTDTLYASQSISMQSVVDASGGGLSNSLSISDVSQNSGFTLGSVATSAGGTFQSGIYAADGTTNFFPSFSETNAGTYGGSSLGNFTSASITSGTMTIAMTNHWPVDLSMSLELVNTTTGATIQSFSFSNVSANGGTDSDTKSLAGKTLPNTIGMKVVSISSPGSFPSTVPINVGDSVALNISTNNLVSSSYNAPFPSINESNVGTYGAGVAGFTSASFSGGSLAISLTNDWPIPMNMGIDLVDTTTGNTILTYSFANVSANGGSSTVSKGLGGVTLPAELGIKITSITSPGSSGTSVNIDLQDALTLEIIGSNMQLSQFTAPFPAFNQSDVFSQSLNGSGFESATFSDGIMTINVENEWPIDLSFDFDVYDTITGNTILTYSLSNVSANGGVASQQRYLSGKTFPNTTALKFANVSSTGSSTDVLVDVTDKLNITVNLDSVKISAAVAEIPNVLIDSLAITQYVDLDTLEIQEILFNTCDLTYNITSDVPSDLLLRIILPSSNKMGSPIDTTINIPANGTTSGSISMNSTLLDFSQGDSILANGQTMDFNSMPIILMGELVGTTNAVSIANTQGFNATFGIANLDFVHVAGYFGKQSINLAPQKLPFDASLFDLFDGEITFEEPVLSFDLKNNIGVPIGIDLDFTAYRNGTAYSLNAPQQLLPYPTTIGDSATGLLLYDNTNTDITSVFTLPFDSVTYSAGVTTNPDTSVNGKFNFLPGSPKVSGDILLELPFVFTTTGITLSTSLDSNLNIASQLPEQFVGVEYAKLIVNTRSTLPMDAEVAIQFFDDSGNLLLVKLLPLIESGTPNAQGVVTTPNVLFSELMLDNDEFELVKAARVVNAEATMSTYDAGSTPVKLRTDATLGISIGIEAKAILEL